MGKVMQVGLSLLAATFVAGAILLILITASDAAETSNKQAENQGVIYVYHPPSDETMRKRASYIHY